MTDIAIASSTLNDAEAGKELARKIRHEFMDEPPDALIVFASPDNDYEILLETLSSAIHPKVMIGCSSAGEFTSEAAGTGLTSAMALRSTEMKFRAGLARGLSENRRAAAASLADGFEGRNSAQFRYRTAIVLIDALAGNAGEFVDDLTIATGGTYQFVGGGAGDDANFRKTYVFFGSKAHTDAAVALEVLSNKPIGIGARHGWTPAGDPLRVTEAAGSCVSCLNLSAAVEAFDEHATATHQKFDRDNPVPFFLHNILGVKTEAGHQLRVPLGVSPGGGVTFAAEVPSGSTAQIMSIGTESATDAAATAVRDAVTQVERAGFTAKGALFFDCVATRLRLGKSFGDELAAVAKELGTTPFAGFNSYGQIVRAEGQFNGFHNCTAVVCVFPD